MLGDLPLINGEVARYRAVSDETSALSAAARPARKRLHTHLQSAQMTRQPRITHSEVEVPAAAETLLGNGIRLYTLASEDFEVLRISFSIPRRIGRAAHALLGLGHREPARGGVAGDDGRRDRRTAGLLRLVVRREHRPRLRLRQFRHPLEILRRDARRGRTHPAAPRLSEEELRTYCAKRKQRLAIDRTKVDVEARETFARPCSGRSTPTAHRTTRRSTTV